MVVYVWVCSGCDIGVMVSDLVLQAVFPCAKCVGEVNIYRGEIPDDTELLVV